MTKGDDIVTRREWYSQLYLALQGICRGHRHPGIQDTNEKGQLPLYSVPEHLVRHLDEASNDGVAAHGDDKKSVPKKVLGCTEWRLIRRRDLKPEM